MQATAPEPSPTGELVAGAAVILVAGAILYEAADLDFGTLRRIGPGLLPTSLGCLLLACGAGLCLLALRPAGRAVEAVRLAWRGPVLVGIAILVFAATIEGGSVGGVPLPALGLAIAGPVTLVLAGSATGGSDMRELAATGLGLTAACLALFNDALGMELPVLPAALEPVTDRLGAAATLRLTYLLLAILALLIAWRRRRG